jgi:hypothetical protein
MVMLSNKSVHERRSRTWLPSGNGIPGSNRAEQGKNTRFFQLEQLDIHGFAGANLLQKIWQLTANLDTLQLSRS